MPDDGNGVPAIQLLDQQEAHKSIELPDEKIE